MSYDPNPWYAVAGRAPVRGYALAVPELGGRTPCVLAVDGPAALPWERVTSDLAAALRDADLTSSLLDVRQALAPWQEVRRRTARAELPGDPVFARVFDGTLAELFDAIPSPPRQEGVDVAVVAGPGSALVPHDVLWYADVPKRVALEALHRGEASNLGQPPGEAGSEARLLFVDWPLLDGHKQALVGEIDRYLDLTHLAAPHSLDGGSLRRSLARLAEQPFRTRPTYLPGPWGGQWLRRDLGIVTESPNLAWSYELITPEGGILLGSPAQVEVGFELLMAAESDRILGPELVRRFGLSFPIRFDYLDTFEGGHLSIQCHPTEAYMRETFGLPYTQHESYYVMASKPGAAIFLGLRDGVDLEAFRVAAEQAEGPDALAFEPERFLQMQPAQPHRLYLIPAGTAHASGAGNVVLEISATPYLYTLRFYDWLRRDLDGGLRPVHVRHAFANLDPRRAGDTVRRELMPEPRAVRTGPGWVELELGRHPDLFFVVNRLDFEDEVADRTGERFHVLNLVGGDEVEIETASGTTHRLSYAETVVVPAAVGGYRVRRIRGGACKVVKAFVA